MFQESFDNLFKWWQLLHGLGKDPAECLLIGNKNDMESERAVSSQEAEVGFNTLRPRQDGRYFRNKFV